MTPQQLAEQQRQQNALNEWEREDAIRKTTMKTLLLFLWTNRHALAALIIKTLEAKLKEDRLAAISKTADDQIFKMNEIGRILPASEELTQRGPMVSIPTVHDTASAILEAKK